MVYDKKRSGDPDYDDKVPADQHVPATVTGPDGQDVYLTETNGPVNPDGSHANLDAPVDEQDNRPAPGGTATEASAVQVATPVEDTEVGKAADKASKTDTGATKRRS